MRSNIKHQAAKRITGEIRADHALIVMNDAIAIDDRSTARSCARCGTGFNTSGKQYTCPACRKPRTRSGPRTCHALSFREQQIVALITEAKANKEIAYRLCLSEGTVKEYLYHIFRKLNVTSRTELALRSVRDGFTDRLDGKGRALGHVQGRE